jgi:hypothetical protein
LHQRHTGIRGKTSHAVGALMASRLQSLIDKFDRSGVSGSTGRGRSQALESKVRFADKPPGMTQGSLFRALNE